MKVTFKGIPGEPGVKSLHMYGQNFPLGEAVEVTDPHAQRKLAAHPHFEADGEVPAVDDANLRTYVNTVMDAGLTTLHRAAEQKAQQKAAEAPPTPPEPPTPPALRSAAEYQAMELSGKAPVAPKTADELRAELEKAEQAEKEATDANADAQRAGRARAAQAEGAGPKADSQRGQAGKGR
jgi:type IV secretory pathway VirB10-like protein